MSESNVTSNEGFKFQRTKSVCRVLTMENCYSCRSIGIFVSLTFSCFILSAVISLATNQVECGDINGQQCSRNVFLCSANECYCQEGRYGNSEGTCEPNDSTSLTTFGDVVAGVCSLLFWVFLISSIVSCICYCCHADDDRNVVVAPAASASRRGEYELVPLFSK